MQSLLMSVHFNEPCVLITVTDIHLRESRKRSGVIQTEKDTLFIRVIWNIDVNMYVNITVSL